MAAAALALLAVAAAPSAQAAEATRQAYHERTLVLAADARCRLFAPRVAKALEAAALQTRGTLLRAGVEAVAVNAIASRARAQAQTTDCADPDLAARAQRIVHAFDRWSRAARIDFPARNAGWFVDRFKRPSTGWRMVQNSRVGRSPVRFGLAGVSPDQVQPTVVISYRGQSRPYAARLVLRDTRLLPGAYGVENGQGRMPPVSGRQMVLASERAGAASGLLVEGERQGEAWTFNASVMQRLEALDPREPFWIEFLFHDDSIARVPFEAGDIAAARAFLELGPV